MKKRKYQIYFTAKGSLMVEAFDQIDAEVLAEKELLALGFSPESEQSNLVDETEITEIIPTCMLCEEPEDDDGRCGCTNKDAN